MDNENLFHKGWFPSDDTTFLNSVANMYDNNSKKWLDSDYKPRYCSCCPFSVWYRDYKRCTVLKRQLHQCFRVDARLKSCPVKIVGLEELPTE